MKIFLSATLAVYAVFTLVISVSEGNPTPSETLKKIQEASGLPALGYIVVQDGEVKDVQAVGLRRINASFPVTINDKWQLGSCGKAMTSTMVARLVEKDVLQWNTTLQSVFGKTHPDLAGVTLQQLLTHTAGLIRDPDDSYRVCLRFPEYPRQRACGVAILLRQKPKFPPGTKFSYSNFGYIVAAAMAERVTRKSYGTLMREELFGPLGINGYGFGAPAAGNKDAQPWGHFAMKDGKMRPALSDDPLALAPSGDAHMSLQDWARFARAHLQGGKSGLLRQSTFDRLHTPVLNRYAFGWLLRNDLDILKGKTYLWHSGSNGLWYVVAILIPEADTAVLFATNVLKREAQTAFDTALEKIIMPKFLASRV